MDHRSGLLERNLTRATAALGISMPARVVDQDTSHYLRRDGEEVGPIGPLYVPLVYEPNVGLVDQGRGLQCVAFTLPDHVAASEAMKFGVNEWIQIVECSLIPLAPLRE